MLIGGPRGEHDRERDEHRLMRRLLTPAFSAQRVKAHYCIGAGLARIELREVFGRIARRLPTLRLAVPRERLRVHRDRITGGFAELPVTW